MSDKATVGEVIMAFLEECGVGAAFGVISIHNMPFLDAIGRRGRMRYISARSEPGAINMADAYARVGARLGVAFTSTGTAAGNASGAMVEAQTAGTPLLHITGQIDLEHVDKEHGFIHEARDQLSMLKAVSKSAWRVTDANTALDVFKLAVRDAMTAPTGPVSVEVPIDIQQTEIDWPADLSPLPLKVIEPDPASLDAMADQLVKAKRPMLWLGGGARHAGSAVNRFIEMGFGIVTSTQGRGVVAEDHPATLGAYNIYGAVEAFYDSCDAMLVAGSRLRGNETLKYQLRLPRPLYQIDVDGRTNAKRPYVPDYFTLGDSALALNALADRLSGKMDIDPAFIGDLQAARTKAEQFLQDGLEPYGELLTAIQSNGGDDFLWVRDVTISNSTWGNRAILISGPRDGVHAAGGGIGQSIQMAIGAAIAEPDKRVICLAGDGGLQVNIGELATATQEGVRITLILMNSQDYEVIKNIQDAQYGGRRYFSDIFTPDFSTVADSNGWQYEKLSDLTNAKTAIGNALKSNGSTMIEVDMATIGAYARPFGGPPVKKD
ncbi:MAG: thiamine pyrophosphate-binding protein [Alphaproteobacteria bacterium]|jgi:acetolactate synthase I/II/III large subunit|nr:thiamine pyrophosphate-binding protein [Alphaproteobacteria bacterium]